MRIAFTSCHFTRVFAQQPVWTWIAQHNPDHLVLLGDKFYLDLLGPQHPDAMSDDAFAQHQFALYGELIAQPEFAALAAALPGRVHALWDDHDFLWNDACGAEVHPLHSEKVHLSTAFLEAFRAALAQGLAPGSFAAVYNDARFWDAAQPPLATPSLALAPDVMLHLSDGRTFRTRTWGVRESKRTLLGAAQRDRFMQAISAQPQALHLFASGSTVAGWQRYATDLAWLESLAANQRLLVLSGDIHRNRLDAFYTGGFPLHEATASGAAVRDAVVIGAHRENFGLLDIDALQVTISLFKRGQAEDQRVLDRHTWLPV
jgi:alkaline phosphatase D